jgi:hypothetical protein
MVLPIDVVVSGVAVRPGLEGGRGAANGAVPDTTLSRQVVARPEVLAAVRLLLQSVPFRVQT